jgi:hypothetical protein
MGLYKDTKLKKLLTTWPQGTVYLSSYLNERGIGYDLQRLYRKSGWMTSIGQGAVIRTGDEATWQGAVYALQQQAQMQIHVGAKTALNIQGFAHFINLAQGKVQLFGPQKSKLPTWFKNHNWGGKLEYHRSSLFGDRTSLGLQARSYKTFEINISTPERAILELLDLVPQKETFSESALITESLSTLRPKVLQQLLNHCTSIKVKRLFLYLAEKQSHAWLKRLDLSKVDLGAGDRQIVKGGVFDSKYRITVPKEASQ